MDKKAYRLGILVGRFQGLHAGHESMIEKAIELCERVGVFIGSSQEAGTNKNPFTYEERKEMLRAVFGERIEIYPLPDIGVGNNATWGEYVLQNVREHFDALPDLLISGKEERRIDWFDGEAGRSIAELCVPKSIGISATEMKDMLFRDDRETWRKYTNPKLWNMYDALRQSVLRSADDLRTDSL